MQYVIMALSYADGWNQQTQLVMYQRIEDGSHCKDSLLEHSVHILTERMDLPLQIVRGRRPTAEKPLVPLQQIHILISLI